jgi:iron complex outermembrane receptor protein
MRKGIARGTLRQAVLLCGVSLISTAAAAQSDQLHTSDEKPSVEAAPKAASALEDIVVMARRSSEKLQKVPLTVTAISGAQLRAATITTGTDIQKLVPNLSVGISIFGATQQYSLRGIRDGVVEYINEVPADSVLVDSQLWDLSSVQAVAGPQGTLFGRNSTGGTVLFVPQRPTKQFGGFAQLRYGSYNLVDGIAVVNLPVSDALQLRVGAQVTHRDGITKNLSGNDLGKLYHKNFRVSALFTPTDSISDYAVFNLALRRDTPVAQVSKVEGDRTTVDRSLPGGAYAFYEFLNPSAYNNDPEIYYHDLLAQEARGIRHVDVPIHSRLNNNLFQFTNILTDDLGVVTLRYIAGYQGTTNHQLISDLSIPLPVIVGANDSHSHTVTQEGQILGKAFGDRLDWVAGVYYSSMWGPAKNTYLLFAPVGTPFNDLTTQQSGGPINDTQSLAGYAQGTFALTSRLKLTGGIRYTSDHLKTKQFQILAGGTCNLPIEPNVDQNLCLQSLKTHSDAVTYNISLDYQATPALLLYATTRRGYNAGGFNPGFPVGVPDTVKPEFIRDYEAGLKANGHLGSAPFRFTLSGFGSKYTNIQRTVGEVFPLNGVNTVVTAFVNAASAKIYGAQFEGSIRPLPQLTLDASYGYLHTKYDRFVTFIGDGTGNKFAQAPKSTLHVGGTYAYALPQGEISANVSYSHISAVNFADVNLGQPGDNAPGYGLVDLRLDWNHIGGKPVDIGVYVKNLTNKVYVLNASDDTQLFGFVSLQYGDPRTVGVELRYTFGE